MEAYKKRKKAENLEHAFFVFENPAHLFRIQERYRHTLHLLKSVGFHPLTGIKILDVGCGDGFTLRQFLQWGAQPQNLSGIDLLQEPVDFALQLNPNLDIHCGSAAQLPWSDTSFDLICLHTVFSSILDAGLKQQIAVEINRVLEMRGAILWYDFFFDNPNNSDVKGINKSEIKTLFPRYKVALKKITLAPPITRRIPHNLLPVVYPMLTLIPFLRTHYMGVLFKPEK